ncbi:MAG TPA: VTT domain-containing protein [Terriglobales bacterium]|nr:VTT domain-containing protein [Terriglobales bacterium]
MNVAVFIVAAAAKGVKHWLFRLGGPGMILVALIDNSFIPLPGSLDVFTILLSAGNHPYWPYYASMATLGSVIGAYLTYRIGKKGGKEMLEKKIGKEKAEKVYQKFETAGFTTVTVGVMIPPPFPVFPLLLAAGALQYPTKKFLSAIAVGRAIRFTVAALLGVFFGRAIIGFFSHYYKPALYGLLGLAVVASMGGVLYYFRWRKKRKASAGHSRPQEKAA